jgi:hypothetical protein
MLVPSPWIVYLLLALLFSTILMLLTVRMLRPTPELQGQREPRKEQQEREAS